MSLSQKVSLKVDWCSYQAAKYAVEHWHYSMSMPAFKRVTLGVWESGVFTGAIIFGNGANLNIGEPFGLSKFEVVELVRVALKEHNSFVSECLRIAVIKLKQLCPKLRLLVSYADEAQGHVGSIYQASNWIYVGVIEQEHISMVGRVWHKRTLFHRYGTNRIAFLQQIDPQAKWVKVAPKHKYLLPLDRAMRRKIEPLALAYPKRAAEGSTLASS